MLASITLLGTVSGDDMQIEPPHLKETTGEAEKPVHLIKEVSEQAETQVINAVNESGVSWQSSSEDDDDDEKDIDVMNDEDRESYVALYHYVLQKERELKELQQKLPDGYQSIDKTRDEKMEKRLNEVAEKLTGLLSKDMQMLNQDYSFIKQDPKFNMSIINNLFGPTTNVSKEL